jgi:hypothetical protein
MISTVFVPLVGMYTYFEPAEKKKPKRKTTGGNIRGTKPVYQTPMSPIAV